MPATTPVRLPQCVLVQPQHPVAAARKGKIVGSDERGKLVLAMQPGDQFKYRLSGPAVEVAGRLIRQQELRPGDERAGQSHALLLSAGKFSGPVMRHVLQVRPHATSASLRPAPLSKSAREQQRHGHVFQRREFGQQVVELPDEADFAIAKFAAASSESEFSCKLAQYTSPAEALSRAPRMCNKVLFPAPDSPTIASISPLPT